ncbi:NAD(P)-binding domain-containing protein, partial [Nocardia farcinica]|uniref:NAD(P)-binding domain-containing protein n=1 Tax=Nocardia farcinica TaxID=37329 RepID=UPI0024586A9A
MQLGMIGLGRMGGNIVRRIVRDGHTAVGYERKSANIEELRAELGERFQGTTDLREFVAALETPRVVWVMIPAGATGAVIAEVAELLEPGDIVIDGGNSRYHDDIRRAEELKPKGIHYVDIGTSGGVFGLDRGFCLMIGGEPEPVAHLDPLLKSIAPGVDAAPRPPRPPRAPPCFLRSPGGGPRAGRRSARAVAPVRPWGGRGAPPARPHRRAHPRRT